MARNKYPEKTIDLILDVSLKLFNEKGYEKTTVQDIVDNLGGLSKGAVYHHFKSKAEIFEAVTSRTFSEDNHVEELLERTDITGFEKLKLVLDSNVSDPKSKELLVNLKVYFQNSEFLAKHVKASVLDSAPVIAQLIEQGIADGSIKTDYPLEVAETISLCMNTLPNPAVFNLTEQQCRRRLEFIKYLLEKLDVPIIDDEFIDKTLIYMEDILLK